MASQVYKSFVFGKNWSKFVDSGCGVLGSGIQNQKDF